MRGIQEDTPPSSVSGDEIHGINEDDGMFYIEELEEIDMDDIQLDDEQMVEGADQEEEIDIEPPVENAALVFKKHEGSVFSCDIHPSGTLAATGGEDDNAYVWNVETGQLHMNCMGHKDSVIFVGFSHDGELLATADMSGLIKVWKYSPNENEAWDLVFSYEADDVTWGLWHFGTKVLIIGTVLGDIYAFKVLSGETKVLKGHHRRVECGKLLPDGIRLAAGYEDGAVKIWDIKTSTVLHTITIEPQVKLTAIDTHPENSLIAAICPEGKVFLITPNNGKIVGQLEMGNELEAVAFSPDPQMGLLALGTLSGSVSIWDSARQMVRHHCAKIEDGDSGGVTKMFWIKNQLVTGCLDGSIRIYEGRTGEMIAKLTGNRSEVLDLCYNDKKNLILTTSDDESARIFKYEPKKDDD